MVALRQARIRYSTARDGRALQEDLLVKAQQMFSYGAVTIRDVVAAQSSLLAAESVEIAAQSAYSHARTSLDQVLGETLETHHVSVDDSLTGRFAHK
jgi:outer membrane protein